MRKILGGGKKSELAGWIVVLTVFLGSVVVVLSSLVSGGFRSEIERRVFSLLDYGQIESVGAFWARSSGVAMDSVVYAGVSEIVSRGGGGVVEGVVQGGAVLQNGYNVLSCLVRGVDGAGEVADGECVVSSSGMRALDLSVGDTVDVLVLEAGVVSYRALRVVGEYSSGLVDLEQGVVYVSVGDARGFAGVEDGYTYYRVSGEVDNLEELEEYLGEWGMVFRGAESRAEELYGWLDMIDNNMWMVLMVMLVVCVVNVVTSTLIITLDCTARLGVLRAMGMSVWRSVWFFVGGVGRYLVLGVVGGAGVGLLLGWVQGVWRVLGLDVENYFVEFVPVSFDWASLTLYIIVLLFGTLVSVLVPIRLMARREIVGLLRYR